MTTSEYRIGNNTFSIDIITKRTFVVREMHSYSEVLSRDAPFVPIYHYADTISISIQCRNLLSLEEKSVVL